MDNQFINNNTEDEYGDESTEETDYDEVEEVQEEVEIEVDPEAECLSLGEQCFSPPKHIRSFKKQNAKLKKRHKTKVNLNKPRTKPKRPPLVHSADSIKQIEHMSIADTLTEIQDKLTITHIQEEASKPTISPCPPSASIYTKKVDSNYNYWNEKSKEIEMSPFDRQEIYSRIGRLLKLALKGNHSVLHQPRMPDFFQHAPPSTPSTSSPLSPYSLLNLSPNIISNGDFGEDSTRQLKAQNVWKEIFDYFEFYNDRAESMDEIDRRLEKVREEIPQKIEIILNTCYTPITSQMNLDMRQNMKSPGDYSQLYEHKVYTEQLCYLYWLVVDVVNEIGYIESLYPSQRLLRNSQPAYADAKFESTTKTLLLWYKIMTDLMHKSDQFGRYLGFAKRPEYMEYWTWFDQKLNYSRSEYERVQNWLSTSGITSAVGGGMSEIASSSTLMNKSSNASAISSPIITLTKPTFCNFQESNVLHERQISYMLKSNKTNSNLLYHNYENNYSPSCHAHDLTSENTNDLSSKSNLSSFSMLSDHTNDRVSPEALTASLINSLNNDHLKQAKLHHLNSFILNRTTSNKSTSTCDTPGGASPEKVTFNLSDDSNLDFLPAESQFYPSENILAQDSVKIQPDPSRHENRQKIFSEFLRKRLRKFGLTRTCDEIRNVILDTLSHALLALQIDRCERTALTGYGDHFYYHLMPLHHKCKERINSFYQDDESIRYGVHSDAFKRLDLPSFRPLYLYLSNVILDLMHLCIRMQIENKRDIKIQPDFSFSLLSIEVLTKECRECIEQSILVRQFYYHMVYSVFDRSELDIQTALENDLSKFDEDLKEIINIYLNFITDWVQDLVKIGNLQKALGVLKTEWNFCKNNLYFVTASEDMYANRFCTLSSYVNDSLIHWMNEIDANYKEPLKDQIARYEMDQECSFDSLTHEKGENVIGLLRQESVSSIDINLSFNEFKEEINQLKKSSLKALGFCGKLINDLELAAKYQVNSPVQELLEKLKKSNHVLVMFTNPELNSSYLTTPDSSCSSFSDNNSQNTFMIFVPQEFTKDKIQIIRLLFIISEKDDFESTNPASTNSSTHQTSQHSDQIPPKINPVRRLSSSNSFIEINSDLQRNNYLSKLSKLANINQIITSGRSSPVPPTYHSTNSNGQNSAFLVSPSTKTDGYLLYLQLPKKSDELWKWDGNAIELYASVPVRRSLYQHKTMSDTSKSSIPTLILVTSKQSILSEKRIEIKTKLQGSISLIKEKTSFHPNISIAIDELKDNIIDLRRQSVEWIKSIEKDLKVSYSNDSVSYSPKIDQKHISEIWRVSYNFGIELQKEFIKFMTQDRAQVFSQGLSDFSILWCEYIVNNTARGKGRTLRPWAANKGIQLIQEAMLNSVNLKDSEFIELKKAVEKCILHVIGDRNSTNRQSTTEIPHMKQSFSMIDSKHAENANLSAHHQKSVPQYLDRERRLSRSSLCSSTNQRNNRLLPPKKRFAAVCQETDRERESALMKKKFIGKILEVERPDNIINATEVNFRWQLGLLIGEGQFGKVYSCVNLDNGEPMAMKEIQFKSNDIKKIKEIADEINNVRDIDHENLVKVYGAELHRKEILIFMEFCGDQCTLNRISRDSSGLPENMVRNYTKSLLKAVDHLHEKKIMHRDIKGANIFLKTSDPKHPEKVVLKLGDFGCSIRFKDPIGPANKDRATGFMGTFAFMAPEVMASGGARDAGYTYSADIWSIGCVVIEMFTGKQPWHPLSEQQIVYKVHIEGKQQRPSYPTPILDEAMNFLNCCFELNPNERWSADKLLDHNFVKIEEERYEE